MYYIEKADKHSFLDGLLKIIKIEDDRIVLPYCKKELDEKQSIKLASKTNKILEKTLSKKVVLSKEIHQNEVYKNILYSYGYDIVDGKWLFEAIVNKVLNYIVDNKKLQKSQVSVSILLNNLSKYALENIKLLSNEYKSINIVTNHISKFKYLQDKIYDENGLIITVANNKKKSLVKSNIILNIDFPEELINKYRIFDEAIIVSLFGKIRINTKRFNGIIISDYEINTKNIKENNKYYTKDLYEAQLYQLIPFSDLQEKIKNDNVEIKNLFSINGRPVF